MVHRQDPVAFSRRAILRTCRVLPPADVTEQKSGMQVQYSAPFNMYSVGSQVGSLKLRKHGLQKALLLWDM